MFFRERNRALRKRELNIEAMPFSSLSERASAMRADWLYGLRQMHVKARCDSRYVSQFLFVGLKRRKRILAWHIQLNTAELSLCGAGD
jgi:hypothetical protein